MIATNSRARRGGGWAAGVEEMGKLKGSMDKFEGRTVMLTTGEWCYPVSNMLHHL